MAAGLQRDVHRGALNRFITLLGVAQRADFGVRTAGRLGRAFAQHTPVAHDDATDPGVGRRREQHALC
ncbi:hypothetical protein G6F57_023763 [Rhizopus arrhizus]|nr:hypothetical protein G6F57_023763 [Rhizopus arrhizus]